MSKVAVVEDVWQANTRMSGEEPATESTVRVCTVGWRASLTWTRKDAGEPAVAVTRPVPEALLECAWGVSPGVAVMKKGEPAMATPAPVVMSTRQDPAAHRVKGMGYRPPTVETLLATATPGDTVPEEAWRVREDAEKVVGVHAPTTPPSTKVRV